MCIFLARGSLNLSKNGRNGFLRQFWSIKAIYLTYSYFWGQDNFPGISETLRRLQESGSILDHSRPLSRHRDSSSRGYRTIAPAGPTPSTSRGLSSSSSTSRRPSDGEQSYHRRQAKRWLTEINGKLAEAEDRLGKLTRELNARRDLERRAQAAREEVARLCGIRKEFGEDGFQEQVRGASRTTHSGPQP